MLVPLRFVSLFLKPLPIQLSNNLRRVSGDDGVGDDGVGGDVFGCYAGGAYDRRCRSAHFYYILERLPGADDLSSVFAYNGLRALPFPVEYFDGGERHYRKIGSLFYRYRAYFYYFRHF